MNSILIVRNEPWSNYFRQEVKFKDNASILIVKEK